MVRTWCAVLSVGLESQLWEVAEAPHAFRSTPEKLLFSYNQVSTAHPLPLLLFSGTLRYLESGNSSNFPSHSHRVPICQGAGRRARRWRTQTHLLCSPCV